MFFDFLKDFGNYDNRVVSRWDNENGSKVVSTAAVSDGREPFETAVAHPSYNDGKIIIVECYHTKEEAEKGHQKWLDLMLSDKLPLTLTDCGNAAVARLLDSVGGTMAFEKKCDDPEHNN